MSPLLYSNLGDFLVDFYFSSCSMPNDGLVCSVRICFAKLIGLMNVHSFNNFYRDFGFDARIQLNLSRVVVH